MLAHLLDLLFPARADEQLVRTLEEDSFLPLLDPELAPLGEGESAAALLPYADKRVSGTIHEAKYRGNDKAFALLAAVLTEYLRELAADGALAGAVLIPIPLGGKRLRERGFNQVEQVVKIAAKELSLPVESKLLIRTRETASQVSLPRWRRKQNMRDAFGVVHVPDPSLLYIVVDDVLTTGATLSAALEALREAGAREVLAIALAH